MAIDEELLARNNTGEEDYDESASAGNFRENQRLNGMMDQNNNDKSLRELKRGQMSSGEGNNDSPAGIKGKIAEKMSPFLATTDRLLQASWENLITSFGLTLIWIDIHFFLNKVLGPMAFRELGEEWVPDHIKKLGGEKAKEAVALTKKVEEIGCGCLNLGCVMVLIGVMSIISMIAVAISNPFETIWDSWLSGTPVASFITMVKGWF